MTVSTVDLSDFSLWRNGNPPTCSRRIPEQDRPRIFDGFDHILKVQSKGTQMDTDIFATIFSYAMELTAEKRCNPSDDIRSAIASAVIPIAPWAGCR